MLRNVAAWLVVALKVAIVLALAALVWFAVDKSSAERAAVIKEAAQERHAQACLAYIQAQNDPDTTPAEMEAAKREVRDAEADMIELSRR